ncbi:DUF411 domain-containing protein [Thalassotalea sp. PLHSN55]|uniref:DUF411 domain-containing protein n=1 Tax=Thalassotalea sp. PLHSN55 TaxID=3435888 RepID=UPI003F837877
MSILSSYIKATIITISTVFLFACSDVAQSNSENSAKANDATLDSEHVAKLTVYKSPTCGCCQKWIDHLSESGLQSKVIDDNNMSLIKEKQKIEPRFQSCHTAISKEGYVFEGHVPAKYIQQFLAQEHHDNVLGLSVPAMPVGSPGMEVEDKFMPYKILVLMADGSAQVYAQVDSYQQQF